MLTLKNINAGYGKVPVLRDVSLEVGGNELVSVVGSNGAGKSTIVRTISGLVKPTSGEIWYEGDRIDNLHPPEIVRRGIAHVPENRMVFASMTVKDNLSLGAYTVKNQAARKESLEFVYSLFPRLEERQGQAAGTLSGGEQQMLAIGRGLMSKPKMLILDEPSLGIMPKLVTRIMQVAKDLRDKGLSILLVEQRVRQSLEISDRAYLLQTGRVIGEGTGKDLLESDLVRRAYLGL